MNLNSIITGTTSHLVQFAAAGTDPISAGAIKLLNYAEATILILIPLVAVVMVGQTAIKKMHSQDESEQAALVKKMQRIATYAAVGEVGAGLITWFLSFFQG